MFFLRNCQKLHDGGSMHEKKFGRPVDKHYQAWQRLIPKNMCKVYITYSGTNHLPLSILILTDILYLD